MRAVSLGAFPLLLAVFAAIYAADHETYRQLLKEDGPVENATVLCLLVAGGLAFAKGRLLRGPERRFRWFYLAFAVFCLLVAVEELSWGQRIVHLASPEFFKTYNRQRETNVHNVIESLSPLTTRDYAGAVFVVYGVCLPIAVRRSQRWRKLVERFGVVVPPIFLAPAFVFATVLQLDYPTGYEEELGELFFSLCAALFMWAVLVEPAPAFRPVTEPGGFSWPD